MATNHSIMKVSKIQLQKAASRGDECLEKKPSIIIGLIEIDRQSKKYFV